MILNAFHLRCDLARLCRHFGLAISGEPSWNSDEPFAAGNPVAVVEWNTHGRPILETARFGFKMRTGVLPMTNHRVESINLAKASRAFLEGRCLVPVDLFHEHGSSPDGGTRQLSYAAADGRVLGLAAMLRPQASGLAVTILTKPASGVVRSANGRMPVIVAEEDYDVWLDDTTPPATALALLGRDHGITLVERHP